MVGEKNLSLRIAFLPFLALLVAIVFYLSALASIRSHFLNVVFFLAIFCFSFALVLFSLRLFFSGYRALYLKLALLFLFSALGLLLALQAALRAPTGLYFGQKKAGLSILVGKISEDPRHLDGGRLRASLALEEAHSDSGLKTTARGTINCYIDAGNHQLIAFADIPRGSRLRLMGDLRSSERGDYFLVKSFTLLSRPKGAEGLRNRLRKGLIEAYGKEPWGGMALALLLGWRDGLEGTVERSFREAGASHVLALSGMHLAVISFLIAFLLKKPLGFLFSGLFSLILLSFYVWVAGAQSSLLRALFMYGIAYFCTLRGLSARGGIIISISFLIHLAFDPASAMAPSFVLSYLALAGILLLSAPFDKILPAIFPPVLRSGLAASLAAFIAALPAQAIFFGECRPIGILSSIPLSPLASLQMIFGLCWLPLKKIWAPLALPFSWLSFFTERALVGISSFAAGAPMFFLKNTWSPFLFTLFLIPVILYSSFSLDKKRSSCDLLA